MVVPQTKTSDKETQERLPSYSPCRPLALVSRTLRGQFFLLFSQRKFGPFKLVLSQTQKVKTSKRLWHIAEMKRRLQSLVQKTYGVFRTPLGLVQPQEVERARALLLRFPEASTAPDLGESNPGISDSLATLDVEIHDHDMSLRREEEYTEVLALTIQHETRPIASTHLPSLSDVKIEDQQGAPQYTNGPTRIIISHDGPAMLLTKSMVADLSNLIRSSRELKLLETQYSKARNEVNTTQEVRENSEYLIDISENEEEKMRIRQEMEQEEPIHHRNIQRRDELERKVRSSRENLEYMRDLSQETFEKALNEANLLDIPDIALNENPASSQPQSLTPGSVALPQPSEEATKSDQSERITILEEVERTRQNLFQAQESFDATRDLNEYDRTRYRQAEASGETPSFSEDELDLFHFQRGSMHTRALIDAQQEHEKAKAIARAHGLLENQLDQESDFVDDPDDGYLESQDADMMVVPDQGFIHNWTDEVVECQNLFALHSEEHELDAWEKRTVAMFDTLSCVDLHLDHRKRIDYWHEKMRSEREECQLLKRQVSLKRRDSMPQLESRKRVKTEEPDQSAFLRRSSYSDLTGEASERWRMVTYHPKTLQCIFFPNSAIGQW